MFLCIFFHELLSSRKRPSGACLEVVEILNNETECRDSSRLKYTNLRNENEEERPMCLNNLRVDWDCIRANELQGGNGM